MAPKTIWIISNRQDDRVVLWEQDAAHPGGEAFVGGSAPDLVARTPLVEARLREGLVVEIPEPPDGRKKPIAFDAEGPAAGAPDQPGQPTRLGRALDPELVPEGAQAKVQATQEAKGEELPVPAGVEVPPAPEPERTARRR